MYGDGFNRKLLFDYDMPLSLPAGNIALKLNQPD